MTTEQYLQNLSKEELIELMKKLNVSSTIISGAYQSSEKAIRDLLKTYSENEILNEIIN